jgi:hypothetical protein
MPEEDGGWSELLVFLLVAFVATPLVLEMAVFFLPRVMWLVGPILFFTVLNSLPALVMPERWVARAIGLHIFHLGLVTATLGYLCWVLGSAAFSLQCYVSPSLQLAVALLLMRVRGHHLQRRVGINGPGIIACTAGIAVHVAICCHSFVSGPDFRSPLAQGVLYGHQLAVVLGYLVMGSGDLEVKVSED